MTIPVYGYFLADNEQRLVSLLHQMVFATDETRPDTEQMLTELPSMMEAIKAQILAELSSDPVQ